MCAAPSAPTLPPTPAMPPASGGWLGRLWQHIPSQCAMCHTWPAQRICTACQDAYARVVPRCTLCALQLPAGHTHGDATQPAVCTSCLQKALPGIDVCHARVSYQWPWQSGVDAFKFAQQPGWAQPLAQLMAQDHSLAQDVASCDLLVPMPLHPQRMAERGYNQSLLLARGLRLCLSRLLALPPNKAMLRDDGLVRTRHTLPQSTLPFAARQRNIRNAFAVPHEHRHMVEGKRVVLVDDVLTTGASASAAAQALKAAGAAQVVVAVFARTEKP